MKAVINGKLYDTTAADMVFEHTYVDSFGKPGALRVQRLYKTTKCALFLYEIVLRPEGKYAAARISKEIWVPSTERISEWLNKYASSQQIDYIFEGIERA